MRRAALAAIGAVALLLAVGVGLVIQDALTRPQIEFDHLKQALP